jgi:hypothetical protein
LSLSGSELPPPTVGGSPFTSGGHVARLSGDGGSVDCASETFAAATVTNAAMIGTAKRKAERALRLINHHYCSPKLVERLLPIRRPNTF